jgi:hypothetical protein
MPYQNEVAGRLTHVDTAHDPVVQMALRRFQVISSDDTYETEVSDLTIALTDLDLPVRPESVTRCLGIDGSRQSTDAYELGNRRASVWYIRAGVTGIDLAAQREITRERFIDHVALHATQSGHVLSYPMPGAMVSYDGLDMAESWRAATDALLAECTITDAFTANPTGRSITLAEALLIMFGEPDRPAKTVKVRRCPTCHTETGFPLAVGPGGGTCNECSGRVYMADVLSLDTVFNEFSRENSVNSLMNAVERLILVCAIELLRVNPVEFGSTILVADGPLAAIGTINILAKPMLDYLDAVGAAQVDSGHSPMLVVGVEKSGDFVDHGRLVEDLVEPGHVMRLTDEYIGAHILGKRVRRSAYGSGHMYGRRFFYRRRSDGLLLTITIPAAAGIAPWSSNAISEDWSSYPTLRPIIELLEELRSSRYEGAVQPLTLAHRSTALGRGIPQAAMTSLTQDALGMARNSRIRPDSRF